MIYFLMAVLVIDLLRLVLYFFPQPQFLANNYEQVKKYMFLAITGIAGIVVLAGHINALNPRVKRIDIHINKKAGQMKSLHENAERMQRRYDIAGRRYCR
jgi:hypothetical protein